MSILICSLKSMGKSLQNELYARPVPSKLSERLPPLSFLAVETQNGQKLSCSHFGQLLQCNFFKKCTPSESSRPELFKNVMVFLYYNFWTRVMDAQTQQSLKFLAMLANIRGVTKNTCAICDRYTSYYANFTFSDTISPLSLSWVWQTDIMVWSYIVS